MSKVVVHNNLTLDGVMQAPGGPEPEENPFAAVLNNRQKYVASTTLEEPLSWRNSTLLRGDAAEAVATLKGQPGKDLVVLGSGELVQSLMRHNLVETNDRGKVGCRVAPCVGSAHLHLIPPTATTARSACGAVISTTTPPATGRPTAAP